MSIPPKFVLFECANMDYLIRDIENQRFLNRKEEVELLNDLSAANEHLCNILSGTYNKKPENFDLIHKIRELRKENWKLKKILTLNAIDYNSQQYDDLDFNKEEK